MNKSKFNTLILATPIKGFMIMENFPGTCIAFSEDAVLFRGPSGCGKSDLALRCINRGATLISDDQTVLCKENNKIFASPPATIAGKLEVRGLGIVEFPYIKRAQLALVLDLSMRTLWKDFRILIL